MNDSCRHRLVGSTGDDILIVQRFQPNHRRTYARNANRRHLDSPWDFAPERERRAGKVCAADQVRFLNVPQRSIHGIFVSELCVL